MAKNKKKKRVTRFKNGLGMVFTSGTRVRLNRKAYTSFVAPMIPAEEVFAGYTVREAIVKDLLPDTKGLVLLATRLGGYWTWNVDDLEVIT